ncbi:hypothetical protein [Microcoleus sp. bin38.metabat.b11b12b14.051]|uniref:hypothetical protein n=1 Tax=Microcoleus sp. bin38.metabat.b11b12b14.051 TaxID=2742709 RepID=UPI0025E58325|nr:hypothetical protein [Microcoleus sp. bin38.metabat.b11b12b14.051]
MITKEEGRRKREEGRGKKADFPTASILLSLSRSPSLFCANRQNTAFDTLRALGDGDS